MGQHEVEQELDELKLQAFMSAVLDDLRALDYLIEHDQLETEPRRIGAEQEMFLVGRNLRVAPRALEVIESVNDPRLTTEIARFNLEANLTPRVISGNASS